MFRSRMAALALTIGSLSSVIAPATAVARDRDDDWRGSRQERKLSERERHQLEQQRIARERYLREQAQRQRYVSPYRYSAPQGFYDRFGQWHSNSYPGFRY